MPNAGPTVQSVALLKAFTETSFANDDTASLGSFTDIPFQEGTATFILMQETHDPMHAVQSHHDYREEVLGKKSCSLTFTLPFAPTGVAADVSTTAVRSPLGLMLAIGMGIEVTLAAGSAAVSGWTSSTGDVTAAQGSRFVKGGAVGWVNSSSILEMRPLENVATDTLTTKLAFSATPANTDALYNAATYALADDPDSTLQFVVQGLESGDEFVLMGCQLQSMTFNLPLDGTIPTVGFTWQGVNWLHGDDAAGTFSDITPVTYSNTSPITGQAGRFLSQTNATATYTGATVNISALAFDPQLAYQAIPSPSGTQGVLRWRLSRNNGPSISGSFTTYYEDQTWFTARDSKLDKLIWYQVGTAAGQSFALEAGTVQITDVQRIDGDGIASLLVSWKGRNDGDVASAAGATQLSPARVHFG